MITVGVLISIEEISIMRIYLAYTIDYIALAFMRLNRCAGCGCEIEQKEPAYFRLNAGTDRFELLCEGCYTFNNKKEEKKTNSRQTTNIVTR